MPVAGPITTVLELRDAAWVAPIRLSSLGDWTCSWSSRSISSELFAWGTVVVSPQQPWENRVCNPTAGVSRWMIPDRWFHRSEFYCPWLLAKHASWAPQKHWRTFLLVWRCACSSHIFATKSTVILWASNPCRMNAAAPSPSLRSSDPSYLRDDEHGGVLYWNKSYEMVPFNAVYEIAHQTIPFLYQERKQNFTFLYFKLKVIHTNVFHVLY